MDDTGTSKLESQRQGYLLKSVSSRASVCTVLYVVAPRNEAVSLGVLDVLDVGYDL